MQPCSHVGQSARRFAVVTLVHRFQFVMMAGWSISPDWHELRTRHVFTHAANANLAKKARIRQTPSPSYLPAESWPLQSNQPRDKLGKLQARRHGSSQLVALHTTNVLLCTLHARCSCLSRHPWIMQWRSASCTSTWKYGVLRTECMLVATTNPVTGRAAILPPLGKFYLDWGCVQQH
jgi:hypothetical protein